MPPVAIHVVNHRKSYGELYAGICSGLEEGAGVVVALS